MNILVIDGQGGMLGSGLVKEICANFENINITAVGTNAVATAAMLKAGAKVGATGENPVIVAARTADIIVGPIGILAADSMLGEVTPAMATAVGQSSAIKLLLPVNLCHNIVVGTQDLSLSAVLDEAVATLQRLLTK